MNDVTEKIEKRLVRYGDLLPCKTAFIDAHTPGSDQKETSRLLEVGFQKVWTNMYI